MNGQLAKLRARGFDRSTHVPFTKFFRVKCSACEALVINGTPCHETGCEQTMHECRGCNEVVPAWRRYCEGCA